LNDLVSALNAVQPFDWASFLRTRVYDVAPQVPEGGITNGGYRLIYNDTMSDWMKHLDMSRGAGFGTSVGMRLGPDGSVDDVTWDGPAFKAGISPDMHVEAVNDQKFTIQMMRDAILAAEKSKDPIKLLLKRDDQYSTIMLDYHGGLRYPHLERVEGTPDRLDDILAPVK
jgi:predicted metalloprotease with PDZ domain